jgi:hypothetical protein
MRTSYAIAPWILSFSYASQPILGGGTGRRVGRDRIQGIPTMSLLRHRVEQTFHLSDRQAATRSAARWAMVKRVCSRALAVLLMVGLLAGLIALKTVIFLPRLKY